MTNKPNITDNDYNIPTSWGGTGTRPESGKFSTGYISGEKPKYDNWNFFLDLIFKWLYYFDLTVDEKADLNGDQTENFSVANGTTEYQAINKGQFDTKADLNGDQTEKFSAANGTTQYNVVNKGQLDAKANLSGSYLQNFSVANGTTEYQAVNKRQLDEKATFGIRGLVLSNNITNPTTAINISSGGCSDSTSTRIMTIGSTIIKKINVNWVQGTNQGGFPSNLSLAANTWYRVFLIGKTDGTIDAGYDTASNASNLLSSATGYTLYRRLGWVHTNSSSQIISFIHEAGSDIFWWNGEIAETTSYSGEKDQTISCPSNYVAKIRYQSYVNSSGSMYIEDLATSTEFEVSAYISGKGVNYFGSIDINVNSSSLIHLRTTGDANASIYTAGYYDNRNIG